MSDEIMQPVGAGIILADQPAQTPNEIKISKETLETPPEAVPPLTVFELKRSYVYLNEHFFTAKLSPLQYGFWTLQQLKNLGLGTEGTAVLGYSFCADLSPVLIAVYGYYCYNGKATVKEVAKKRKLTPRIVSDSRNELIELGLLVETAEGLKSASLEDLFAPSEPQPVIGHYAPEEGAEIVSTPPAPVDGSTESASEEPIPALDSVAKGQPE